MGKFFKGVVKFSVAAAAVGGLCYAFTWTAIGETLDMQRRYGQGHIDTKDAKTAVYDKTDSGSWGPSTSACGRALPVF